MNRRKLLTLALTVDIACWSGLILFILFLLEIRG